MMKNPIKLIIRKPKPTRGDWAFYREVGRILLTSDGNIQTEAQLCWYIYKMFGEGRYSVHAFQKGYKGFWIFWLGDILPNGFIRDLHKIKGMEAYKRRFEQAKTYEEKANVEEEMQFEKEIFQETKKFKRRGPVGIIKSKPGRLNEYERW